MQKQTWSFHKTIQTQKYDIADNSKRENIVTNSTTSSAEVGKVAPLTADDLETVIAIDKANTGTERRGFFEKRLAGALERPGDYIYVGLHADDQLVGFALAKLVEGEFGSEDALASFDAMGVNPDFRGKGAGHRLMTAVEDILRHKGVKTLTTQADWSNISILGFFDSCGFKLADKVVVARDTSKLMPATIRQSEDDGEIDHSSPDGDDFDALSRDQVPVRSMTEKDLAAMIKIDMKTGGHDRSAYFERKQNEVLNQSGVRVSLVAELDGFPVGFIMARVDLGGFGRTSPEAVMDTIGVNPDFQGHGVGKALIAQLMANLAVLQVETVRTEIDWNDLDLIAFLSTAGFKPSQTVVLSKSL